MKTVQFFWPTLYVAAITLLLIELCGAKQGSVCKISLAGITKVSVGKSQEVWANIAVCLRMAIVLAGVKPQQP